MAAEHSDGRAAATQRFAALCRLPPDALGARLDEAALLIAAHATPDLDVGAWLTHLDGLAEGCPSRDLDGLVAHLFGAIGLRGAVDDYAAPECSYLDQVLERRQGIPISLSVIVLAVGRRLGLDLVGVGMPGHFLVCQPGDPPTFLDAYAGGLLMPQAGAIARFRQVVGPDVAFDQSFLAPTPPAAILLRMLTNLKATALAREDVELLAWVAPLRSTIPGVGPSDLADLAGLLVRVGRWDQAARALEALADRLGDVDRVSALRTEAVRLRARLN